MIITHINPDWDSIGGTWLLKRFGGMNLIPVTFVNTGNPDPAILAEALAVVDTGKEFDPDRRRFDHHQLPGSESNETCATKQVFEHLMVTGLNLGYLRPLVDLIFAGDTGRPEADFSRKLGVHAELSGYKAWYKEQNNAFAPDEVVLAYGFGILDVMEVRLRNQAIAQAELETKTVYKSADNRLWAIKHGSPASSFAAQEQGAILVVFEGEPIEKDGQIISYPVGIHRAGEATSPHVGELVKDVLQWNTEGLNNSDLDEELGSWFLHNGGFFGGRGTGKAVDPRPVMVDLGEIARLVDKVWRR